MRIEYHPKAQSGVTELMYVGDVPPAPNYKRWWLVAGGLLLAAWLLGRKK